MIPVVVIGGGLAGSSAALRLASAGIETVLLEREAAPHDKVCGEFLSAGAVRALEGLGLDLPTLGGIDLDRMQVEAGRRCVERPLPFRAVGLSRRILDEALLDRAITQGVDVRRGRRVTSLRGGPGDWTIESVDGRSLRAAEVFLATGKHDLRGWGRPPHPRQDMIGFKVHFRIEPSRTPGAVSLHLFPGGYAGIDPVGCENANLCLVVRKSAYAGLDRRWGRLIDRMRRAAPRVLDRLQGSDIAEVVPTAVSGIPYGHVQRRAPDGLWRLGDQAAVIPSFTGEGMAIALMSGHLAASTLIGAGDADLYQQALARRVLRQVTLAQTVSRLMVTASAPRLVEMGLTLAPNLTTTLALMTRTHANRTSRTGANDAVV